MMKHMKTRLTALFAAAAMALSLAGCGSAASSTASASAAASGSGQQADYTVGILQYTSHSSLDEIAAAIQSELEQQAQAAGVTIRVELKNGQGDAATINDICKMFVSDGVDLIIPIATPAATAAAAAVQGTDIPLVYSAVTDPVEAQLAQSMEAPGENMTGTSDYIDTAKILDLVLANNPDTKTLGLIYNLGETNSATTIEDLRPVLEEKGIQAVESTVTTPGLSRAYWMHWYSVSALLKGEVFAFKSCPPPNAFITEIPTPSASQRRYMAILSSTLPMA